MAAPMDNTADLSASIDCILNDKISACHLKILKSLTNKLRDQEYRDTVEEEVLVSLSKVLTSLSVQLQAAQGEQQGDQSISLCLQVTAECFRGQRNACVQSTRNQDMLRELGFIEVTLKILRQLQSMDSYDGTLEPLRCGIQFLGNVAVGNQACKEDIWEMSFPHLFLQLLSVADEKTVAYTSMVLHTCLDEGKVEQLVQPQNILLALRVLELCNTQSQLDWPILTTTQHFFKSSALMESMYSGMTHQQRLMLLELLSAQMGEVKTEVVPPRVALYLASHFQQSCNTVLTLALGATASDQEALTVIGLLDVLCEMTSGREEFVLLQEDTGLLISTIGLLQQVHALGKASKNVFSSAQNFSSHCQGGDASTSPSISFKAHLIRLIGNLCHGNTNNQNKVRELEGLPLILDNCNIDSNNPFISQWAIFAIRNLLEHNKENQQVVAALERRGTADYSALRELGFEIEERDGSLLLKPVKKTG